jgi:hypothetical protein
MAGNVIQEFLVSIGFELDQKSHTAFKKTMAEVKASFTTIGLGVASVTAVVAGLSLGITKAGEALGNITTGVDKFALSLYTTTQNARSLQTVMDTMGIKSLEDLKYINLMPEQRKQFMELRQLSQELAPDDETKQGLAELRKLGFQFQRMQIEMASIGLKFLGTIGRLMATPLFKVIPPALETIIATIAWIGKMVSDFVDFFKPKPPEKHLNTTIRKNGGAPLLDRNTEPVKEPKPKPGQGDQLSDWRPVEAKPTTKNLPMKNLGKALRSVMPKVTLTPAIRGFLAGLDLNYKQGYTVTSGLSFRSGPSWHPKGLAVDLVPNNKTDKGYADLVQASLMVKALKKLNLELNSGRYLNVERELDRRGVNYKGRLGHTKTSDYTGEHLHATVRPAGITIHVNGAKDPHATAQAVKGVLQANKGYG